MVLFIICAAVNFLILHTVFCNSIVDERAFSFAKKSRILSANNEFECFTAESILDCVNSGFHQANSCALNFNTALNQCCLELSGCCQHNITEEDSDWISAVRASGSWFNWSPWSECSVIDGSKVKSRTHVQVGGSETCNDVISEVEDCPPRDCGDILLEGWKGDGIYDIFPDGEKKLPVYCKMDGDGFVYTVIQTRKDGSVNFFREWNDYKVGFGQVGQEIWLGNDNIYKITSQRNYSLRIELKSYTGLTSFAEYNPFSISDEQSNYVLSLGTFRGTAGDSFIFDNDMPFSTKDRDNDNGVGINCALEEKKGGWWYSSCATVNLNGLYFSTAAKKNAIYWLSWTSYDPLQETTMMIKRI